MKEYDGLFYTDDFSTLLGLNEKNKKYEYIVLQGTKTIKEKAFMHTDIKNIIFNTNLEFIGDCSFKESNIENIMIILNSVKLGNGAFLNNPNIKAAYINTDIIPTQCFSHSNISDLKLPYTKKIEYEAFRKCTIDKLDLKKVEEIGPSAFEGTEFGFDNLILPPTLKSIDAHAFKDTNLKNIYLSSNIEYLNENFCSKNCILNFPENLIKKFPFLLEYPSIKIIGSNTIDVLLDAKRSFKDINKVYKQKVKVDSLR